MAKAPHNKTSATLLRILQLLSTICPKVFSHIRSKMLNLIGIWNAKMHFKQLKHLLTTAPVLRTAKTGPTQALILSTDARIWYWRRLTSKKRRTQ